MIQASSFSLLDTYWIFLATAAVVIAGCGTGGNDISLTVNPQSGTFRIEPSWPNHPLVDSSGDKLRMPDGVQVIMDAATFEKRVEPLLSQRNTSSEHDYVHVHADFLLAKEDVVIGVVENQDGGTKEKSRTYWVVKIDEIHSAAWHRSSE